MTSIVTVVIRRLLGVILILAAVIYAAAMYYGYDVPQFDLPNWVHSPVFYAAYIFVTVWCWLPALVSTPSRRKVNLTPTNQGFEVPMEADKSETWGKPFEMPPGSGEWYIQGYGQYWQWDTETNQYQPYGETN
jgi:hypothetical protein